MGALHFSSLWLITGLLLVGLFFFIRASVKDRTESIDLHFAQSPTSLAERLQGHFQQRAYHLVEHNPERNVYTLEGTVAPSLFLAVFLSVLAAIGLLCIALVLAISLPHLQGLWLAMPFVSPIAGVFYWKRARRIEQVSFQINQTPPPESALDSPENLSRSNNFKVSPSLEPISSEPISSEPISSEPIFLKPISSEPASSESTSSEHSWVTVTAHRDELIALRQALKTR